MIAIGTFWKGLLFARILNNFCFIRIVLKAYEAYLKKFIMDENDSLSE